MDDFFCSSLDIRDDLKVAFFGKKLTSIISKENSATFISGNQYNRLSQQSFLAAVASLSNSREKCFNTTERQAQGGCAVCNKNFTGRSQPKTDDQCKIYWEADPQPSAQVSYTASAQSSGTVPPAGLTTLKSLNQLPDIYLDYLNFFPNKPLSNYLWWPMMKTNFYPFFRF